MSCEPVSGAGRAGSPEPYASAPSAAGADPVARFAAERLVVVLRGPRNRMIAAVEVMVSEGLRVFEVTFTVPDAPELLGQLRALLAPQVMLGAGTIMSTGQAAAAVDAGAEFLVSPHLDPALVEYGRSCGCPLIPGIVTPTEAVRATAAGASAVKLFPASSMQPSYLADLAGPLPGLRVMPTGGVALTAVPDWLGHGALAIGLGGALLGDFLDGGSESGLRHRAAQMIDATALWRAPQ